MAVKLPSWGTSLPSAPPAVNVMPSWYGAAPSSTAAIAPGSVGSDSTARAGTVSSRRSSKNRVTGRSVMASSAAAGWTARGGAAAARW